MVNIKTHNNTLCGLRLDLLICLFLSLITLAVYWQVTNHEFLNFDDPIYVTDNHHIQNGLTLENIVWAFSFTDKRDVYWHPLTWFSHMLDCQGYGLNPGMHHLSNLIFHMANCVLLFLVFKRMTGSLWKSAFIAALFALHPINVDSVAWVAERKNVLSTFFWMLTLLSYAYYCEHPRASRYLLTFLAFTLGLLTKPMLVTLPFVLLLLDYWPLERLRPPAKTSASHLVMEKAPFFIISAISIHLSTSSLEGINNWISFEQAPMSLRISNALVSYVSYIGKMVWPQNLAIFYPYPLVIPFWKTTCAGLFLIFVSLLVVLAAKQRSYLAIGWFWFLGTLVPVIGLVQTGLWPAIADRWAYVPLIGLYVMIAWGTPELFGRWRNNRIALTLTAAMLLSILTSTTLLQLRYWTNSITLFEHALEVTTENSIAHNNIAVAMSEQGRFHEAADHYAAALEINPMHGNAHYNLGVLLAKQKKDVMAVEYFYRALRINPHIAETHRALAFSLVAQGKINDAINHFSEALQIDPKFEKAHNGLASVLAKQGRIDAAISHYSKALNINHASAEAHNGLGVVLANQGKIDDAINHFSEALQTYPNYADAHHNLAIALANQNKLSEAIQHFHEVLRISPRCAKAHSGLGFTLANQGKISEAINHYSEALAINAASAEAHNGLGAVLANNGRIDKAIYHFSEALRCRPTSTEARINLQNALKFKAQTTGNN